MFYTHRYKIKNENTSPEFSNFLDNILDDFHNITDTICFNDVVCGRNYENYTIDIGNYSTGTGNYLFITDSVFDGSYVVLCVTQEFAKYKNR